MTQSFDVIILGAGAAGLMCAIESGKRGRKILVLEKNAKPAGKILISGGGRCNFTNYDARPDRYVSQNPHFCKSALSRYTPQHFLELVHKHDIPYFEKKLGQLFCKNSAKDIVVMLLNEMKNLPVQLEMLQQVSQIHKESGFFRVESNGQIFHSKSLVVATGGLSIPQMGASDFGYKIAKEFNLEVTPLFPALDGFAVDETSRKSMEHLAGVSCLVSARVKNNAGQFVGPAFEENLLFTHKGLSGPALLQTSLYWQKHAAVLLDFLPMLAEDKLKEVFNDLRRQHPQQSLKTWLSQKISERLALFMLKGLEDVKFSSFSKSHEDALLQNIKQHSIFPLRTVGYQKAEVTKGGVSTYELSSKTLEAQKVPGLYFIGEVVDVTGWLGGYNFQWAWSSGWAAGQNC